MCLREIYSVIFTALLIKLCKDLDCHQWSLSSCSKTLKDLFKQMFAVDMMFPFLLFHSSIQVNP